MAETNDFNELIAKTNTLPGSWAPRREQPEWDRAFDGRMEINSNFTHGTDKAADWMREALAFSEVIKTGFETADGGIDLPYLGQVAREHIAKGRNQGLDSDEKGEKE